MSIEAFKEELQTSFDMCKHAYGPHQLLTRPLSLIKPNIGQTRDVRESSKAEADHQTTDRARNEFLFQVRESCKQVVQVSATKVIEHTDQANMRLGSNITNETSHKKPMVRHTTIIGITLSIVSGTDIIQHRIAVIFDLKRATTTLHISNKTLDEPVLTKFRQAGGPIELIRGWCSVQDSNDHILSSIGIKSDGWIEKGEMPAIGCIAGGW